MHPLPTNNLPPLNTQIIENITHFLITDFELDKLPIKTEPNQQTWYNNLRNWIAHEIDYIWHNNRQKLVYILYKVDISEKKLNQALKNSTDTPIPYIIADLIINREVQKATTRYKYQEYKAQNPDNEQNKNDSDAEKWD